MKVTRTSLTVDHRIGFPRPAAGLVARAPQLLEAMSEGLGLKYPLASSDVSMTPSSRLDDWSMRFMLFNGLALVKISADGLGSTYRNLSTDADIEVAIGVESTVMRVLAEHSPALQYSSEKLVGQLQFAILGGNQQRNAYFEQVVFPGRSSLHQQISFRAAYQRQEKDAEVLCEIAPLWADPDKLFVAFDVELSRLTSHSFEAKAQVGQELISAALNSFGLETTEVK